MKTYILLEITNTEKATDLLDKVAGRTWTIDGVKDVTAKLLTEEQAQQLEDEHATN